MQNVFEFNFPYRLHIRAQSAFITAGILCVLSPMSYGQVFLNLALGADQQSVRTQSISAHYLTESDHSLLLYGSETDEAISSVDLTSVTLGGEVSISLNDSFDLGLSIERWGNSGDFTIETLGFELSAQSENWNLSVRPRLRKIKVITGRSGEIFELLERGIDSTGFNLRLAYQGSDWMSASVFYSKDRYDWDFSNFDLAAKPRLAQIFSPVTISLSQGLENSSLGIDLSFYYDFGLLGVEWIQNQSVVTGGRTNTVVLYGSMDLGEHWNVGLDLGVQIADQADDLLFSSISFGYVW